MFTQPRISLILSIHIPRSRHMFTITHPTLSYKPCWTTLITMQSHRSLVKQMHVSYSRMLTLAKGISLFVIGPLCNGILNGICHRYINVDNNAGDRNVRIRLCILSSLMTHLFIHPPTEFNTLAWR
jgi:hypothetical protein